ncbi:flagellar hook-basal body protein FliE [Pontibacillus halophilus JSM 076056 = DSM 19796]|uniref:Flagellar hook-basal body complex protein FliE n=1 Tax=Pontibacillus halophilus JSM 076056 = DSM 19796 TaxID=1385510 RepID=A0A0A5GPJ9_9BACI|nr:flagellar hook-basal body complex protein FliE [Pontibacillus halophilus]KGX93173.1 flagellar hook-basal body protein FliE [Pontibacillus halophilus JSM 076056 = DSM 19796]
MNGISQTAAVLSEQTGKTSNVTPAQAQQSFATSLKNAIESVNEVEHTSNMQTEALAKGEVDNLHDVMISAQKASITVQTAVQVQGKVLDAYREIMRMQI